MNADLEKVESKLNEMSDELDEWAETTGAKVESDAATIARRIETIKSETGEHFRATHERALSARADQTTKVKAKMHEAEDAVSAGAKSVRDAASAAKARQDARAKAYTAEAKASLQERRAEFHEVATKAAEGADEGKAKFII